MSVCLWGGGRPGSSKGGEMQELEERTSLNEPPVGARVLEGGPDKTRQGPLRDSSSALTQVRHFVVPKTSLVLFGFYGLETIVQVQYPCLDTVPLQRLQHSPTAADSTTSMASFVVMRLSSNPCWNTWITVISFVILSISVALQVAQSISVYQPFLIYPSEPSRMEATSVPADTHRQTREEESLQTIGRTLKFPQWNDTRGISIRHLVDFTHGLVRNTSTTVPYDRARASFQEILYILHRDGLQSSETLKSRTVAPVHRNSRIAPTEKLLQSAYILLLQQRQALKPQTSWPRLQELVFQQNYSIPFFHWYGDYRGCAFHNLRQINKNTTVSTSLAVSVPIFTVCASVVCDHAFPFPTYRTVQAAMPSAAQWQAQWRRTRQQFPHKIPQVVWRGRLTNNFSPAAYRNAPRWQVAELSYQNPTILNAKLTSAPDKHRNVQFNLSLIGGNWSESITPMEVFQQYAGVLDVDGNSWSSRFGQLLCYDTVVLKVQPDYVDYFMKDLTPNVHYISVQKDLSDLLEKVKFVLDPQNSAVVQTIIENAHEWCQEHLTYPALAGDALDILELYATFLDQGDLNWPEIWRGIAQKDMVENSALYRMRFIRRSLGHEHKARQK